jgi:hypothetical protein
VTRIIVAEVCGAAHVSRDDGEALRLRIEEHLRGPKPVIVDFKGVTIASVSFFDQSFGMLASTRPIEALTRDIKVENIGAPDRRLLNSIVVSRQREHEARLNGSAKAKHSREASGGEPREAEPTVRGILSDMVGPPHYTAGNIAERTRLPVRKVLRVLEDLEANGVVERIHGNGADSTWESIRFGRNLDAVLDAATNVFPDLEEDLSE